MGVIKRIKKWINHDLDMRKSVSEISKELSETRNLVELIRYTQLTNFLIEKNLHSKSPGITQERFCNDEVVVTLTTFGQRIYDVFLAIESIMQGSVLPNRIVLWLAEDEFNPSMLPQTLLNQQERGLQIEYCKDIKSFKKLIPALKQYPDAILVTIDDDVVYDFDMLERFLLSHKENPNAVCASRLRRVSFNQSGDVDSYLKWRIDDETISSPLLFPVGMGGVLYPPNCLDGEVLNEKAFAELCPFADDVWFFSMARLKGTTTVRARVHSRQGYLYDLPSSSIDALSMQNTNRTFCRNDSQIKAVFDKYHICDRLVIMLKEKKELT